MYSCYRQLAYGISLGAVDEYLEMSEKVARDSLHIFYQGIISIYSQRYLRNPTLYDIQRIHEVYGEKHGFPGMLGSIDCTHVCWMGYFSYGLARVEPAQSVYANGVQFKHGYYLIDGIYNEWSTLVQVYASPVEDKLKYFTKKQ
ncbi:uncharacterized protein LOC143545624 [Bidens hawaiensis]|uniref:uncharacterized protein LOC143545624 n=1 Tax=Bidens hawaiensis TaxID=980011 RepID=UPI00404A5DC2